MGWMGESYEDRSSKDWTGFVFVEIGFFLWLSVVQTEMKV
jgi:hypothetical protein